MGAFGFVTKLVCAKIVAFAKKQCEKYLVVFKNAFC
jgi:hypothetical protein